MCENIQDGFMSFFLGLKTRTLWGWREGSSIKSTFFFWGLSSEFIHAKQILSYCHMPHPQCILLLYWSAVMDLFPTTDLLPNSSFVILQSLTLSKIFLVSVEGLRVVLPLPSVKGRSSKMTFRTIERPLFCCVGRLMRSAGWRIRRGNRGK